MSNNTRTASTRIDLQRSFLLLNGVFWIYFWICFAAASLPATRQFCTDHCFDPYTFWGHGIGLGSNPLILGFMKAMVCVELPSFFTTTVVQNLLTGESTSRLLVGVFGGFGHGVFSGFPNQSGRVLFAGISINGYRLLATMLLSFVQWVLIAKFLSWLTRKFTGTSLPRNVG